MRAVSLDSMENCIRSVYSTSTCLTCEGCQSSNVGMAHAWDHHCDFIGQTLDAARTRGRSFQLQQQCMPATIAPDLMH